MNKEQTHNFFKTIYHQLTFVNHWDENVFMNKKKKKKRRTKILIFLRTCLEI